MDDEELAEITGSMTISGIISPLIVRIRDGGGYEIISGHRRKIAAEKAGLTEIPVIVRSLDDNAAVIALVDSNMHREHILPSERAFAYKMKLDALKHQGRACGQDVHKSRDMVSDTDSGRQVQRYIRLTALIPELLAMVDEGRMALSPAVEISYLPREKMMWILETIESEDRTPSHAQTIRMRKFEQVERLDEDTVFRIMTEEKPNQVEKIKLPTDKIRGFFPKSYTTKQMEDTILKLLGDWQRKRERERQREDAR
jgi:ParB family chromosome partitioning protein